MADAQDRPVITLPTPGVTPPPAGGGDGSTKVAPFVTGLEGTDARTTPPGARVSFNLEDADLPDLVRIVSRITGKRFIYGGKLRSIKATVYSPEKITAAEAYSAFLSILDTNGMTVIPHGRFLKIIESPGVVQDSFGQIHVRGDEQVVARHQALRAEPENLSPRAVRCARSTCRTSSGWPTPGSRRL